MNQPAGGEPRVAALPEADQGARAEGVLDDGVVLAASVVIADDAGRVLLSRRGHAPSQGRWSLPGGKVELGESPAQAAVREALEETSLQVELDRLLAVIDFPAENSVVYRIHNYAATVVAGTPTPGDDATELRWVGAVAIKTLPTTSGLAAFLNRVGYLLG